MKVMRRALAPYRRNPPARQQSYGWVIGLALIGLILWLVMRQPRLGNVGQVRNKEEWEVTYNPDGLPTRIVIHREVKQG